MDGIQGQVTLGDALNANLSIGIEKRCPKCGELKRSFDFYKSGKFQDGMAFYCKQCQHGSTKIWRERNRERLRIKRHEDYIKNKKLVAAQSKKWAKDNPEKVYQNCARWRNENREKFRKLGKMRMRKLMATPKGKLNIIISTRIRNTLNGTKKNRHWERLVGYTANQLKKSIEKQFTPEMVWENHGSYWHIDHKIPISAFNFERPEDIDFKRCWALENLQPLEAARNLIKHDKLREPFQPCLTI